MVTTESFRVDQIVHGYARGHKELARSLDLDDHSRATMVVMSDLLIDRVLQEDVSYLACYPLPSAARHVLARTWSAGPDYRPGSVWTHSLLLDYATLAQIHDLSGLLEFLRRPSEKLAGFGDALAFSPTQCRQLSQIDDRAAAVAIAGVYGDGKQQVVVVPTSGDSGNEALAMALWRQAWPALRRDFGFVTGISDRTISVQAGCALRFSRSSDAAPDLDPGQRALLSDLPETGPTALRRFLSRYVVEAVNPRGAAPQVASIWIDSASDRRTPSTMLAKITRSDGLPRLKRDLVSAELELSVSGKSLVDLILQFRDESVAFLPASTRTLLANLDLQQFRQVVTTGSNAVEGTLGRISFDAVILNYDTAALSQIADRETRPAILRERPMIALSQGFWPDEDAERATLIEALPSELAGNANEIMSAMPGTIGPAAAAALTAFVIRTNPQGVSDLMAGADSVMRRATLATISAHPELTAQLLPELRSGDFALLEAIAEALVASGSGLENVMVWVEVVQRVANGQLADLGPFSSVVICALALKLGGADGLNLALPVFEPTLTSTKRFSLGRDYGRWLERELPSSTKGWSLQMRLRSAAVEAWPPGCGGAGALLLCSQLENSARLVNDVFVHHGRSALEVALLDFRLTRSARRYIRKMLSPPKRRTKMFDF